MHFIIYGAGGVGGCIGARLHLAGYRVTLVARGEHLRVLQRDGLRFVTPEGEHQLKIPAVGGPSEIQWQGDEIVLLTMKSQHCVDALDTLQACAPNARVVCAQNGVANERAASERFHSVIAMVVWLPAVHLTPGVVVTHALGKGGVLDCGVYPTGMSEAVLELATCLESAGFSCTADPSAMRWKYAKLLSNLGNAVEAMVGSHPGASAIRKQLRREALDCYRAAGIECATSEEVRTRHLDLYKMVEIDGYPRDGGSTWQGISRGVAEVETAYLNGEIVEIGKQHQVPTPANQAMLAAISDFLQERAAAGSWPIDRLETYLER